MHWPRVLLRDFCLSSLNLMLYSDAVSTTKATILPLIIETHNRWSFESEELDHVCEVGLWWRTDISDSHFSALV